MGRWRKAWIVLLVVLGRMIGFMIGIFGLELRLCCSDDVCCGKRSLVIEIEIGEVSLGGNEVVRIGHSQLEPFLMDLDVSSEGIFGWMGRILS